MTALTDYIETKTGINEEKNWVDTTKKVFKSAKAIQNIYAGLKQIAESGNLDNAPEELKVELVFYYQQIVVLRQAMISRPAFMELYNNINRQPL